ncbi:hypothetical protein PB01_07285 [Psychrobacillus glaciei]|uniref:Uncharacterized protein n=1 Tax=Psychrobacillus glaciei TaxID=2283160 RepID=A0A5J6SL82_9BACI|nr:hypothetical protein [Psychrobacillus glaciei]QFF98651.1 hypothetical protein PB01_07285 [Psychrobacillus glaciei]
MKKLLSSLLNLCLFTIPVFLLFACSSIEKYEHIEVFVAETMEDNKAGLYEATGYQKVNAITYIEEGKTYIKTDVKSIEDFYDTKGNFIKSEITHSYFTTSYITNVVRGDNLKEELQNPSTILLPDDYKGHSKSENMTKEEKEQVKNHVLSFTNKLTK